MSVSVWVCDINSLPSFWKFYFIPFQLNRFPIFLHFSILVIHRIIIAEHHKRAVSEIRSFVRKLSTSAVEFEHDSADNWEAWRIFAG